MSIAAALSTSSGPLLAQSAAADKETARAAWADAQTKRRDGDHVAALKLFRAAHALMGLPTTGIEVARELAALGQLVEARDLALSIAKMTAVAAPEKRVVSDALKLYESLGKRIATIVLTVAGAPAGAVPRVRIDGQEVPAEAIEAPRKVNPGSHTIVVEAPGCDPVQQTVSIAEAGTERVAIVLTPKPANGATTPPAQQGSGETLPQSALEMIGQYVIVTTKADAIVEGRLLSADNSGFIVERHDRQRVTVERSNARSIHARDEKPGKGEAQPLNRNDVPGPAGVRVHIDSNDRAVSLYRHGSSTMAPVVTSGIGLSPIAGIFPVLGYGTATAQGRHFVCRAPCDVFVDGSAGEQFFLGIEDWNRPLGSRFLLRGVGAEITLRARVDSRPSMGKLVGGVCLMGLALGGGVIAGMLLAVANDSNGYGAGAGVSAALGSLGLLGGIPLLISSTGKYKVDVPQNLGRALVPTSIAAIPPVPLAGAGTTAGIAATWQL